MRLDSRHLTGVCSPSAIGIALVVLTFLALQADNADLGSAATWFDSWSVKSRQPCYKDKLPMGSSELSATEVPFGPGEETSA